MAVTSARSPISRARRRRGIVSVAGVQAKSTSVAPAKSGTASPPHRPATRCVGAQRRRSCSRRFRECSRPPCADATGCPSPRSIESRQARRLPQGVRCPRCGCPRPSRRVHTVRDPFPRSRRQRMLVTGVALCSRWRRPTSRDRSGRHWETSRCATGCGRACDNRRRRRPRGRRARRSRFRPRPAGRDRSSGVVMLRCAGIFTNGSAYPLVSAQE